MLIKIMKVTFTHIRNYWKEKIENYISPGKPVYVTKTRMYIIL